MIRLAAVIPAVILFIRYFVAFVRWATNAIQDEKITPEEAKEAIDKFWPNRDADGNPEPIRVPFGSRIKHML